MSSRRRGRSKGPAAAPLPIPVAAPAEPTRVEDLEALIAEIDAIVAQSQVPSRPLANVHQIAPEATTDTAPALRANDAAEAHAARSDDDRSARHASRAREGMAAAPVVIPPVAPQRREPLPIGLQPPEKEPTAAGAATEESPAVASPPAAAAWRPAAPSATPPSYAPPFASSSARLGRSRAGLLAAAALAVVVAALLVALLRSPGPEPPVQNAADAASGLPAAGSAEPSPGVVSPSRETGPVPQVPQTAPPASAAAAPTSSGRSQTPTLGTRAIAPTGTRAPERRADAAAAPSTAASAEPIATAAPPPVAVAPESTPPTPRVAAPTNETIVTAPLPPPSPAILARAANRQAIARVLSSYTESFSRLDVSGVASVWRSVDATQLAREFATLKSQDLSFDECAVEITDARAVARCPGRLSYVPRIGAANTRTRNLTWEFQLAQADDAWMIERVLAR